MRILLLILPALFFLGLIEILGLSTQPVELYTINRVPFASYNPIGIYNWKRPLSQPRVGIQVGHWKHDEAPQELSQLWDNGGTEAYGIREVDINYSIAVETAKILKRQGFLVDLLPTTIPNGYLADVFISIHADGHLDKRVSGFKISAPRRDVTGRAYQLAQSIEYEYSLATNMLQDTNITENMAFYYAFSWRRFDHAIHPMTPGAIVETGFVTNKFDRSLLLNSPQVPAFAIARGITKFLFSDKSLAFLTNPVFTLD